MQVRMCTVSLIVARSYYLLNFLIGFLPHTGPSLSPQVLPYQPVKTRPKTPPSSQTDRAKRELSLSPVKPKPKRGRPASGRGKRGGRGGTAARAMSSGSTPSEAVDAVEDDHIFTNAQWTDAKRTTLFQFYLSAENDKMWARLKVNANKAHKKVFFFVSSVNILL